MHLITGKVEMENDESADGASVTVTNLVSGDKCRADVGEEQEGWWQVDIDDCMEWEDGDGLTITVRKGAYTGSATMTARYGASQQAPTITLELPEETPAGYEEENSLRATIIPAGGRGQAMPGPYCEFNPLTLIFGTPNRDRVNNVTVNVSRLPRGEPVFSTYTGTSTYTTITFNGTGRYRISMSAPGAVNNTQDIEVSDCGYSEICFNGKKDLIEYGVDCGGRCPSCPTCLDGIQNQGELGIDCGGPCTKPCPGITSTTTSTSTTSLNVTTTSTSSTTTMEEITTSSTTSSVIVTTSTSTITTTIAASCSDGIRNQGEEGVDCGGPCMPCIEIPPEAAYYGLGGVAIIVILYLGNMFLRPKIEVIKFVEGDTVTVKVKNSGYRLVKECVLEDEIPEKTKVDDLTIGAQVKDKKIILDIGQLPPKQERVLEYSIIGKFKELPESTVRWKKGKKKSKIT